MKVLVTGASGFLGGVLAPRMAAAGDEVVAVVRDGARALPGTETIVIDLAAGLPAGALPERVDVVAHLAQSQHFRSFPERADDIFAVNVASTAALLDYARRAGAGRFVLASTGGVFAPAAGPIADDAPAGPPRDFYRRSKHAAETLAGAYAACLDVAILRPFFIYGPGQAGMLVANLAGRVRAGEPLVVQGDPGMALNPVHVDDAAAAFDAACRVPLSGPCNVAGPEATTITGLVRLLAELDGREAVVTHDPDPSPPGGLLAATERMRRELGVTPAVGLREGLRGVLDGLRPDAAPAR